MRAPAPGGSSKNVSPKLVHGGWRPPNARQYKNRAAARPTQQGRRHPTRRERCPTGLPVHGGRRRRHGMHQVGRGARGGAAGAQSPGRSPSASADPRSSHSPGEIAIECGGPPLHLFLYELFTLSPSPFSPHGNDDGCCSVSNVFCLLFTLLATLLRSTYIVCDSTLPKQGKNIQAIFSHDRRPSTSNQPAHSAWNPSF